MTEDQRILVNALYDRFSHGKNDNLQFYPADAEAIFKFLNEKGWILVQTYHYNKLEKIEHEFKEFQNNPTKYEIDRAIAQHVSDYHSHEV
jgi:hypothetical protein